MSPKEFRCHPHGLRPSRALYFFNSTDVTYRAAGGTIRFDPQPRCCEPGICVQLCRGPGIEANLPRHAAHACCEGKVDVEYQQGRSDIKAEVEKLPDPWSLGSYTTYVLWAITPDGRATNLGVIETSNGRGKLKTSFSGSQFALIVNAEPHYAVTSPSTGLVLINVAERVKGTETKITSLAERADYAGLAPIGIDKKTAPVDLVAARYAVAIAADAGAEQYADAAFKQAQDKLQAAETAQASKKSSQRRAVPKLSREAIQAGEDARRAGMIGKAAAEAEARRVASAEGAAAGAAAEERARSQAMAREELRSRLAELVDADRRQLDGRRTRAKPPRRDRGLWSPAVGEPALRSASARIRAYCA